MIPEIEGGGGIPANCAGANESRFLARFQRTRNDKYFGEEVGTLDALLGVEGREHYGFVVNAGGAAVRGADGRVACPHTSISTRADSRFLHYAVAVAPDCGRNDRGVG
jgi:hypothetical protein